MSRFAAVLLASFVCVVISGCFSASSTTTTSSGRKVSVTNDSGNITTKHENEDVTMVAGSNRIVVKKESILINDDEIATLSADAKSISLDIKSGKLTITADGTQVYQGELK